MWFRYYRLSFIVAVRIFDHKKLTSPTFVFLHRCIVQNGAVQPNHDCAAGRAVHHESWLPSTVNMSFNGRSASLSDTRASPFHSRCSGTLRPARLMPCLCPGKIKAPSHNAYTSSTSDYFFNYKNSMSLIGLCRLYLLPCRYLLLGVGVPAAPFRLICIVSGEHLYPTPASASQESGAASSASVSDVCKAIVDVADFYAKY